MYNQYAVKVVSHVAKNQTSFPGSDDVGSIVKPQQAAFALPKKLQAFLDLRHDADKFSEHTLPLIFLATHFLRLQLARTRTRHAERRHDEI